MNDPGLHDPIDEAEEHIMEGRQDDESGEYEEEEEELQFLLPARWWYASTAFPLLAGTFGPMANAFSICALVQNWRVSIPPGGTEEHGDAIKDPKWLIGINAVSLVFALIANVALLLNMARRIPFPVAQPITIIGFWLASVLLIALISVAAHSFRAPGVQDQALTQAYYYAIFAAGNYQLISYLMCITVWGAYKGHYPKDFELTTAQRTLMLQTIMFMFYLLVGALIFSKIEGWEFLDAVYWADYTCLTIGLGDYAPATHLGRGLLFPYAFGGIVTLGLVVGSIRSMILERGKTKISARMTEKTRKRVLKRIAATSDSKIASMRGKRFTGLDKQTAMMLTHAPGDPSVSEEDRRMAEFHAMRRVQQLSTEERKWFSLFTSIIAWLLLWLIGALVFFFTEKNQQWTYFGCIYFTYTTLLTIGYGDYHPMSNSGKPFFVFWSLLAVPTLTILISNMGDTIVKAIKDSTIYLGTLTVLPGEETGGARSRMKTAVMKLSRGHLELGETQKEADKDFDGIGEESPGMIRMPHQDALQRTRNSHDMEAVEHIAKDFERAEQMTQEEARQRGEKLAEDEHRYRRILISEMRRIYKDLNSSTPKHYTYKEWAYYLMLLGEDEADPRYHRKAPIKVIPDSAPGPVDQSTEPRENEGDKKDAFAEKETHTDENGVTKWSWIGNRSPLMGDKEEPEWILEKLFQKLEEDLGEQAELGRRLHAQRHAMWQKSGNGVKSEEWDTSSEEKPKPVSN